MGKLDLQIWEAVISCIHKTKRIYTPRGLITSTHWLSHESQNVANVKVRTVQLRDEGFIIL